MPVKQTAIKLILDHSVGDIVYPLSRDTSMEKYTVRRCVIREIHITEKDITYTLEDTYSGIRIIHKGNSYLFDSVEDAKAYIVEHLDEFVEEI